MAVEVVLARRGCRDGRRGSAGRRDRRDGRGGSAVDVAGVVDGAADGVVDGVVDDVGSDVDGSSLLGRLRSVHAHARHVIMPPALR